MVFRIGIFSALFCLVFGLAPTPGRSEDSSGWAQGLHSRARLVSGDNKGGRWLSGVELALDPGFKTYWRSPGESGLPPRFDWSGSENVKSIEIHWPAPSRSEDAAGVAYVYHDAVLWPVLVVAEDPARPVRLALNFEYGICKDICIPAHASLSLVLGSSPSHEEAISKVLQTRVPRRQEIAAGGLLTITSIEPGVPGSSELVAVVKAPPTTSPDLFIEGPEGWYFSTSRPDAQNRITIKLEEKPKGTAEPVTVTLTLVAGESSIESTVGLDANGRPR